jgi:hypothetical protein
MLRTRVLTSLLACLVFVGLARADEAHGPDSERWMSLPRLREVWQREGLGRRSGVAGTDAYYTLTDDGKAVVALDGATGRDRWRQEMPRPVDADGQGMWEGGLLGSLLGHNARPVVLAGADLLVATSIPHERSVFLASLDTRTGQMRWSRTVECGYFQVVRSAGDWVLQCGRGRLFKNNSLLVLSAKDGAQRAKLTMTEPFAVAPGGGICTTGKARVSCFRLQGGRLVQRWSRSVAETASPDVQATASFVVRLGERVQVFRLSDGRPLFERPPAAWTSVDPSQERMFVPGGGRIEVVRLKDGASSTFPWQSGRPIPRLLYNERAIVIVPHRWRPEPLGLVDARGEFQSIERQGVEIDALVGETALARTQELTVDYKTSGILRGYSLAKLAPPAAALDEYAQVAAVLAHYPFGAVNDALEAVRRLPHGMDRLEQAISLEKGWTQISAIGVAEASRSTRYLAALRRLLGRLSLQPRSHTEERLLLKTLAALAEMQTLQAAEDVFAFWRTSADRIRGTRLRLDAQEEILRAVWRYSAERDWVTCPERTFPVSSTSPDAVLGGEGPGEVALADDRRRWAVLCQARHDDDGDGQLRVETLEHGGTVGDAMRPYVVLGAGPGTEVDDVVAGPKGEHLVVTLGACLYDVDTRTGKASVLPYADGRLRAGAKYHHSAVVFSPDDNYLTYLRSWMSHTSLVVRDLQSGRERTLDLGMAQIGGIRVDNVARDVVLEMGEPLAPEAPLVEWIVAGSRHPLCRVYGTIDGNDRLRLPKPAFRARRWALAGGPLRDCAQDETLNPYSWEDGFHVSPRDTLVPMKRSSGMNLEHIHELPSGPFRWVDPRRLGP